MTKYPDSLKRGGKSYHKKKVKILIVSLVGLAIFFYHRKIIINSQEKKRVEEARQSHNYNIAITKLHWPDIQCIYMTVLKDYIQMLNADFRLLKKQNFIRRQKNG